MRTRAGWIALVLTGGLAVAPATVRAQGELDIPAREEPTVPLPIYSPRPEAGGFYTALEFSMFRMTRDFKPQRVAVRGLVDFDGSIEADLAGTFQTSGGTPIFVPGPPGVPGTFLGSGVEALNVDQLNSQWTYQRGWRFTAGWRFSDATTFEVRWLHVEPATYTAAADIIPRRFAVGPALFDTWLFSPVFNFSNAFAGEAQELGVGNLGAAYGIWNAAQEMTIQFEQKYDQGDFWGKSLIRSDPISRTYAVAGARFSWVWERFTWRTVSRNSTGDAGPQDVAIYSNVVSNRLYGPVMGCQHDVYLGTVGRVGAFSLAFQADFSPMVDIVKERAAYDRGDRQAGTKKAVSEYTFAPQATGELALTWYPVGGIQVRLSWDSIVLLNTVQAARPISFNQGQIGATQDFGAGTPPGTIVPGDGQSDSIWQRKAIRYLDGINFGIGFSF